jgi:hypothetical protein
METREDKLYRRAVHILEGKATGLGLPIMRHLALRRHGPAMLYIANRETQTGSVKELGRIWRTASPLGLTYCAFRMGEPNAAQNMAMSYFNVGNLAEYRRWPHQAVRAGDLDARFQLRSFAIRQPHRLARRLRRLRPYRRDGS